MKVPTALLVAIGLFAGCESEPTGLSEVERDLAALRQATAAFTDSDVAAAAGWSAEITACMSSGTAGAMGFHYGNVALIDGTVAVERPELLLYEPTREGGLRFVGVEYIIPYDHHARDAAPPVLFGQQFAQVDAFGLWGLHAWIGVDNPDGMFAAWNPRVSCEFAPAPSALLHR